MDRTIYMDVLMIKSTINAGFHRKINYMNIIRM